MPRVYAVDETFFSKSDSSLYMIICSPQTEARIIQIKYSFDSLLMFLKQPIIYKIWNDNMCVLANYDSYFSHSRYDLKTTYNYITNGYNGHLFNRTLLDDGPTYFDDPDEINDFIFGNFIICKLARSGHSFINPDDETLLRYFRMYQCWHSVRFDGDSKRIIDVVMLNNDYYHRHGIGAY